MNRWLVIGSWEPEILGPYGPDDDLRAIALASVSGRRGKRPQVRVVEATERPVIDRAHKRTGARVLREVALDRCQEYGRLAETIWGPSFTAECAAFLGAARPSRSRLKTYMGRVVGRGPIDHRSIRRYVAGESNPPEWQLAALRKEAARAVPRAKVADA